MPARGLDTLKLGNSLKLAVSSKHLARAATILLKENEQEQRFDKRESQYENEAGFLRVCPGSENRESFFACRTTFTA